MAIQHEGWSQRATGSVRALVALPINLLKVTEDELLSETQIWVLN